MARTIHHFFAQIIVKEGWRPLMEGDTLKAGDVYVTQQSGLTSFVVNFVGMSMTDWIDKPCNYRRSWPYRRVDGYVEPPKPRPRLPMNKIFSAPLPLP